jgi:hypothetical protein
LNVARNKLQKYLSGNGTWHKILRCTIFFSGIILKYVMHTHGKKVFFSKHGLTLC